MADPDIVEIACARAWSVYLLINRGVDDNDARRDKLRRFIGERWQAGATDTELLAVEGLKYLKQLDGSPTG
jgi:hypothetical protein